jgi:4a-hydroxytetrahydrobiopterin dehydratase
VTLRRLTAEEIEQAKRDLPAWRFESDRIARSLKLKDFNEAFSVMCRIALLAEKLDHHPEWSNVYNRIEIALTTHDVSGLSARDLDMARRIDALIP